MEIPLESNGTQASSDSTRSIFQLSVVQCLAILLAFLGLASFYLWVSLQFPFYFMWDMDHVTTIDTLLIQGGVPPTQFLHPSVGMYLIFGITQKIAYLLGWITTLNLENLYLALNPLWNVAEVTQFLRVHSPGVVMAWIFFVWATLVRVFRLQGWMTLLVLGVIGVNSTLCYQSALIRSELYAQLYWAIALCLTSCAATQESVKQIRLSTFFMGLLMGLSVLTKVQGLLHILSIVILFEFFREYSGQGLFPEKAPSKVLALVNFLALVILMFFAWNQTTPPSFGLFRGPSGFGLNPVGSFYLGAAGMLVVASFFARSAIARRLWYINHYFSGILASFLFCFFVVLPPFSGSPFEFQLQTILSYLFMLSKFLFFSADLSSSSQVGGAQIGGLTLMVQQMPGLLVVLGLSLGFFFYFIKNRKLQMCLCALVALDLIFARFCVRNLIRDQFWIETFTLFIAILISLALISHLKPREMRLSQMFVLLILALSLFQLQKTASVLTEIRGNMAQYGWNLPMHLKPIYGGAQDIYGRIIARAYGSELQSLALKHSLEYSDASRVSEFVFANQTIPLQNLGVLEKGFRARVSKEEIRIFDFSPQLEGSLFVDNSEIYPQSFLFQENEVRAPIGASSWQVTRSAPKNENIAILTRPDLRVLFFIPQSIEQQPAHSLPTGLTVTLVDKSGAVTGFSKKSYVGYEVQIYKELPIHVLNGDYFFLIQARR